jgi:DNA-binding NtrC family response regulator
MQTNSVEALQEFSKRPQSYDLVITDQAMPCIPGIDLAQRMLKIRSNIPIIIYTGFGEMLNTQSLETAGISDILTKPMTREELADAVRRVLDQRKSLA